MSKWDRLHIQIGILKPETARETLEQEASIENMRAAIHKARHESGVVAQVLMRAEIQGLNGEDTYTLLAYHALRMLEDTTGRFSEHIFRCITPALVAPPGLMPSG